MCASIDDNYQELEKACQKSDSEGCNVISPKWIAHHHEGHLVKGKTCLICREDTGSRVVHGRKYGERQHGVMHLGLGTFEESADGHQYCLVAAVSIEVDKQSKFLPLCA